MANRLSVLRRHWFAAAAAIALACTGCGAPRSVAPPDAVAPALSADRPELAAPAQAQPGWRFRRQAIAASHPLAAEAGVQMLRAGGSAVDAAIAAQLVLGLVEPQSSGIGGGAFLVTWDGRSVRTWDGRETAPAAADERLFLDAAGKPLAFDAALIGGRAVGVPGLLRMLEAAHRAQGRLPWAQLFEPAIAIAEQGFALTPRLQRQLQDDPFLRRDAIARALFYSADGQALPVGTRLRNPEYAAVLRLLAAQGADAMYRGPLARTIVTTVRQHPTNPGLLTEGDLGAYTPRQRNPICMDWLSWRLCGMPPPSSGPLAVEQILGIAAVADRRLAAGLVDGLPGPALLHVYTEAARLAFADRNRYVADPDFVAAPGGRWESLLDPSYLAQRAALIGSRSMGRAEPGVPPGATVAWASDPSRDHASTAHLSVVDGWGHAVAMTTSIEQQFGARLMVNRGVGLAGGFLLNNQLTDFSFVAEQDGRPVANRVQGGKRPRSSMSPMLVFDRASGELQLVTGSAGGAAIIHHTAKAVLGMLWQLGPQPAADLPNFGSANGPTLLESGRFPPTTLDALTARGHALNVQDMTSGVHSLMRQPDGGWAAGADPRREGSAAGD